MFWPLHFAWKYFLINSKWVVIKKWRIPEKEEKTASCVLENFCEIFVSSTEFCHRNYSHKLKLIWFCMTCCSDKVMLQRQFFENTCNSPVHTKQFVAATSPWDIATTCHLVCSNITRHNYKKLLATGIWPVKHSLSFLLIDSVGIRVLLYHLLTTWMVLVTHALHFLEASSLLMWKPLRIAFFLLKRWYSMAKHTLESYGRSSRHYPYPTSISYISIPNAHQSTALLCPLLWIISGARYSGVPHKVHVLKRKLKKCNTLK